MGSRPSGRLPVLPAKLVGGVKERTAEMPSQTLHQAIRDYPDASPLMNPEDADLWKSANPAQLGEAVIEELKLLYRFLDVIASSSALAHSSPTTRSARRCFLAVLTH